MGCQTGKIVLALVPWQLSPETAGQRLQTPLSRAEAVLELRRASDEWGLGEIIEPLMFEINLTGLSSKVPASFSSVSAVGSFCYILWQSHHVAEWLLMSQFTIMHCVRWKHPGCSIKSRLRCTKTFRFCTAGGTWVKGRRQKACSFCLLWCS